MDTFSDNANTPRACPDNLAAQTVRENLSRRHSVRLTSPIAAYSGGKKLSVLDWSVAGLRLRNPSGQPLPERFVVELTVDFFGCNMRVPLTCAAVWRDIAAEQCGFRFVDVNTSANKALRTVFTAALEGRLPMPDELLRMPPEAAANRLFVPNSVPQTAWTAARRLGRYLTLGILGFSVVLLGGLAVYNYLFTVDAEIAAVSAASEEVLAPASGVPAAPLLPQGYRVRVGQTLAVIRNDQLMGDREIAAADLKYAETNLAALQDALRSREEFFIEYRRLAKAELGGSQAELTRAQAALDIAQRNFARAQHMQRTGVMSDAAFDVQRNGLAQATRDVAMAQARLGTAESNNRMAQTGHFFTGSRIEGSDPGDLANQIRVSAAAVEAARAKLMAFDKRIEGLEVRSPCDCSVQSTLGNRTWVQQGETLYVLTGTRAIDHRVQALVSQEDAARITVGSLAYVRLANRDDELRGRVTAIDRQRSDSNRLGLPALQFNDLRYASVLVEIEKRHGDAEIGMPALVRFTVRPGSGAAGLVVQGKEALASLFERVAGNGISASAQTLDEH